MRARQGVFMPKGVKDKFLMFVISIVIAIFMGGAIFLFTGCNNINFGFDAGEIEQAARTSYFANINSVSKDFSNALANFSEHVKDKNVDGMKDDLKKTQSLIDDLNKLEVPEGCDDIQKTYSDAFLQLQQALNDYVQIYSDYNDASMDVSVLNERVSSVQKSYDEGIKLLQQADKLASEK